MKHLNKKPLMIICVILYIGSLDKSGQCQRNDYGEPLPLNEIRYWAYQIQNVNETSSIASLEKSHYDMLVIEPTRSDRGNATFDTASMVSRLKASKGSRGQRKLVIAYLDIGEAEDWRWYWDLTTWIPPTQTATGTPSFLVRPDPDGWEGNFPVAFWDPRWKSIIINQPSTYPAREMNTSPRRSTSCTSAWRVTAQRPLASSRYTGSFALIHVKAG